MNNRAFKYMVEFIKEKFEIYYEMLSKELMRTSIFSNIFEKYGTERICNGEADREIMKQINDYIKNNYAEEFKKNNNLKIQIRELVTKKQSILSYEKQERILEYVIDMMTMELIGQKDNEINLEQKIIKLFDSYISIISKDLNSQMDEIFKYIFIKVNKNDKNYKYFREELIKEVLQKKSIDLIVDGKCDAFIMNAYKDLVDKTKNKVTKYIRRYISNMAVPFYVSEPLIIEYINKKIFETGELSLEDLFSGKLNNYIETTGAKLKKNKDRNDTMIHIYQLISQDKRFIDDEYVEFSQEIFKLLTEKYGCSLFAINGGKHDDLILRIYDKLVMKKNSVVDNSKPKKIKHKTKKKKMDKVLRWLAVITVVVTLTASTISYTNMIDYNIAASNVSSFDGYNYKYIYVVNNDGVKPTGKNAYEFYKKVATVGYDENLYGYLSFYNAYQSVRDDRLYIMDTIIRVAELEASKYDDSVSKSFYDELSSCSCFLEFAMKRLVSMGCTEIVQSKYMDALTAYQDAKNASGKGTPMDKISSEHKEVIEEIMKMYRKYSKECIGKFGDILSNSVYSEVFDEAYLVEGSSSRRNM